MIYFTFKNFAKDFDERYQKLYEEYNFNDRIKGQYSSISKLNPKSAINGYVNVYAIRFEELKSIAPELLKYCLEMYKVGKIRREKTKQKIIDIICNRIEVSISTLTESQMPDLLVMMEDNYTIELKEYADKTINILEKHKKDIEHCIDIVIKDYNNNPKNFWGRNKDQILVPIIVSFITTIILTIIINYLIRYFKL